MGGYLWRGEPVAGTERWKRSFHRRGKALHVKKKKVFKPCYISATNGQCMGHIHLHYIIWFSQQPADRSRAGMLGPHFTDRADISLLLPWLGHAVASLWSSARCPEFYPGAILAPCDSPRSTFHVTQKSCACLHPGAPEWGEANQIHPSLKAQGLAVPLG